MKSFNVNLPPPNGFKFLNSDGTTIVANSWKRLERAVIEYRKRLGQSTDNVWEMIVEQVCERAPGFCKDGSERIGEVKMRESLKARAMAWVGRKAGEARGNKLLKVDRNTAIIRTRTCVGCPKRNTHDMGCASCRQNMNSLAAICLDGEKSAGENLGACSVTGEYLPVAVHLFEDGVDGEFPEFCWRRKQ